MNISFGTYDVVLTADGAIWIPDLALLAVADLHFEKDSFFTRFSTFLPPYGSLDTLDRLERLIDYYRPQIFIAAGDSFHDPHAVERMRPSLCQRFNGLIQKIENWYWVVGNHDPSIGTSIKGHRCAELVQGGIVFRHQTEKDGAFEVSGHFHPKTRFSIRGHFFNTPCFVRDGTRLFLPAFGEYTGGLDVRSIAFQKIVPEKNQDVFPICQDQVFSLMRPDKVTSTHR